ncbi:MAG: four helix bundle protein [Nitrospirota bacterium]
MEKKRFTDLIVWQKSHKLFLEIVDDVEGFPHKKAANIIADQILRSSSSISANIAEGYGRHKGKEYEHYLIVARGSLSETENWLLKCRDLRYIHENSFQFRIALVDEISKMLNALIGKIRG